MKGASKKGSHWGIRKREKLAAYFCIFPRLELETSIPGYAPVYLNVYDLTPINGYMYWAGFGVFHSGIEVYGAEYAFGAHDLPTSGVFEVETRQCPGFKFRKSICMGTTSFNPFEVREFMEKQSMHYYGDTYHLIAKNCNHFCDDICYKLTGKKIPKWVNRLAKIGSACNCLLPEDLKTSTVQHDPHLEYEHEKKRLRAFSCFSSLSMPPKEETISSLYLQSHYREYLPHTESSHTRPGLCEEED